MMRGKTKECGGRAESNLRSWRTETRGSLFGSLRTAYLGEFLSITPRMSRNIFKYHLDFRRKERIHRAYYSPMPGFLTLGQCGCPQPHVTGWLTLLVTGRREAEWKEQRVKDYCPQHSRCQHKTFFPQAMGLQRLQPGDTGSPQTKEVKHFESPEGDDRLQPLTLDAEADHLLPVMRGHTSSKEKACRSWGQVHSGKVQQDDEAWLYVLQESYHCLLNYCSSSDSGFLQTQPAEAQLTNKAITEGQRPRESSKRVRGRDGHSKLGFGGLQKVSNDSEGDPHLYFSFCHMI